MPSVRYERDKEIQQHWNNFISLVRQDLNDLYVEQRSITVEIKRLERINRILQHNPNDIEFLLLHKESILILDDSLRQKFAILEAFKNLNNLENAVAIRTSKEILESEKIRNAKDTLEALIQKREMVQISIDGMTDLIYGVSFNVELINQLRKKHNLGEKASIAIALYPIIKSLKDDRPKTKPIAIVETHEEVKENNEQALDKKETYEDDFNKYKGQYNQVKQQIMALLNKYYVLLKEMTPTEAKYYRIYCSLTNEELKETDIGEEEYDEARAKITAIKLFDAKDEMEKMIQKLEETGFSDKDEIEFLGAYVEEFASLSETLKQLDNDLIKTGTEIKDIANQKVFFLTDRTMMPIIPNAIKGKGYQSSLMSILDKGQAGFIQQKKGSNIMPLKIHDKKFKDECNKTVFAVRNSKVIVSYIKLNLNNGTTNDEGIMILTASFLKPNTIQEDTDRVIKEYRDQILRQMRAIEKGDPQQLGLQSMVRGEILKHEPNLEDGDNFGRK